MEQADAHPVTDNAQGAAETPPPSPPKIPWEQRKQIGRFRAYWQTAWMVMVRPDELQQFLDATVCEKNAKRFRRVTFQLTVMATFCVFVAALARMVVWTYAPECSRHQAEQMLTLIVTRMAGFALLFTGVFLATRSLEWFSSPKNFAPDRQDRAISLSCYLCAPLLAATTAGAVVCIIALLLNSAVRIPAMMRISSLIWLAVFVIWWLAAVRAIYFTTGRNSQRAAIAAIALPFIWLGQQLIVAIIPISVVQWALMILSVR